MSDPITVRHYKAADWVEVWEIIRPVFRAGETYVVPRDITELEARKLWTAPPNEAFVALHGAGQVVGTYYLRPNQPGPGRHVCNCGYVVAENARGTGVASAMCDHSQEIAIERGFRAMQFNMVAATNQAAVKLWTRLGFDIVGTLPGAFLHPTRGFVDAHVMFKRLV